MTVLVWLQKFSAIIENYQFWSNECCCFFDKFYHCVIIRRSKKMMSEKSFCGPGKNNRQFFLFEHNFLPLKHVLLLYEKDLNYTYVLFFVPLWDICSVTKIIKLNGCVIFFTQNLIINWFVNIVDSERIYQVCNQINFWRKYLLNVKAMTTNELF